MKKVAVIGGLGFVGLHLIDYLRDKLYEVTVFGRKNLQVLADARKNLILAEYSSANHKEKYDVIINLSYPNSYSRKRNFQSIRDMVRDIKSMSHPHTLVIHTSTLIVFGSMLEHLTVKAKIPLRRDDHNIEHKVYIENMLAKEIKMQPVHIIRLGNVWGPGAANWLHHPANRLVFQEAFPEAAKTSPSNLTDVYNVCDFIYHIMQRGFDKAGVHYHHLAEFSDQSWDHILNRLGTVLGEQPVYQPMRVTYYKNMGAEIRQLVGPVYPRTLFYRMLELRALSSFAKSIVDIVPAKYRQMGKVESESLYQSHDSKDLVYSTQVRFANDTALDWQPALSFEESFARAAAWLKHSGYITFPS